MLINFRVYISAAALLLKQVLDPLGLEAFTGEQISTAIEIFITLLIVLFRFYSGRKLFTRKPPVAEGGTK